MNTTTTTTKRSTGAAMALRDWEASQYVRHPLTDEDILSAVGGDRRLAREYREEWERLLDQAADEADYSRECDEAIDEMEFVNGIEVPRREVQS